MLRYCECIDYGCPVHHGEECRKVGDYPLYRSTLDDRTGTFLCDACATDALDRGDYDTASARFTRSMSPRFFS